jgi:hypothetical protein
MSNTNPPLNDQQIEQLERNFPAASGVAFSNARDQAIRAGLSVMVSEGDSVFEVFPDGQRKWIKSIAPPSPAKPGQTFTKQ